VTHVKVGIPSLAAYSDFPITTQVFEPWIMSMTRKNGFSCFTISQGGNEPVLWPQGSYAQIGPGSSIKVWLGSQVGPPTQSVDAYGFYSVTFIEVIGTAADAAADPCMRANDSDFIVLSATKVPSPFTGKIQPG
jgi:hypothetical protein